jgi:rhodanese-related sulfurtransferase
MSVKTLSPNEAHQFLQAHPNALFVDVRANMEYLFVGHPVGAIHIPWIDEPDWQVNPHFVTQIRQTILGGAGGAAPVVLICRSGVRSLEAGKGFEGALDDHHHRSTMGGWRFHGLPWEQC